MKWWRARSVATCAASQAACGRPRIPLPLDLARSNSDMAPTTLDLRRPDVVQIRQRRKLKRKNGDGLVGAVRFELTTLAGRGKRGFASGAKVEYEAGARAKKALLNVKTAPWRLLVRRAVSG